MARANRQRIREGLQNLLNAKGIQIFMIPDSGPYMRNGYWHCNLDLAPGVPYSYRLHRTIAEIDTQINEQFKETITLHLGEVTAESLVQQSEPQMMVAESKSSHDTA